MSLAPFRSPRRAGKDRSAPDPHRPRVAGLGGVGSFAAEALARSGFGGLILADFDVVAETNLNRQLVAVRSTIGLREGRRDGRAHQGHRPRRPCPRLHRSDHRGKPRQASSIRIPDYVVDAIDDVFAKVALIARCVERGIPIVSSMGFANKLHPEAIRLATIDKTAVCPLARTIRLRLASAIGITAKVPVVYSTESPVRPVIAGTRLGSCAFVPSVAGLYLASHVVNAILEEEPEP
ncbi:MAG: ThiF family adenylyltransferase [Bacillus subtilis]|nr:ThiF family adenylyltransferase [Bacillus subtilis]